MTKRTCPFESDVVAAVLAGSLPESLRAHAESCALCSEVMQLASLVHAEYANAVDGAQVPTADVVWLRSQIRAREDAARAAARPIFLTQAVAIAALIGLLVSAAGRLSLGFLSQPLLDASPVLLGVTAALLCAVLFAPIALYLAFSRD
jgi:hypothetical protein